MLIAEAQQDLRRAYAGGWPGVLVSGLVWTLAAIVERRSGVQAGFLALFFGGMAIFPLSKAVCSLLLRRPNEARGNPFGMTVLECTIAMIGGLLIAWLFILSRPEFVFPAAAVAVGTHYYVFRTAYGNRLFWVLASAITAIGAADVLVPAMRGFAPPLVAATEIVFAIVLLLGDRAEAGRAKAA